MKQYEYKIERRIKEYYFQDLNALYFHYKWRLISVTFDPRDNQWTYYFGREVG